MWLSSLFSKTFFGTESSKESEELCNTLQQCNIRFTCKTLRGKEILKHYHDDPFHIYAKSYLLKLPEFHIIRVNRFDFQKAIEIYNDF